jgi:micrococcal nuclease
MEKAAYLYRARVIKVVDGDTFDAQVDLGFTVTVTVRFRMIGIDTMEVNDKDTVKRALAMQAKLFCVDKMLNKDVIMQTYKTDKYGRWLAEVYLPSETKTVNVQLLEAKLAIPYVD